jgi:predicted ester cyclase
MSEHLNNQTFLQIIEAITRNKPDELDQCMSANVVDHNPIPGQAPGLTGFKQWMNMAPSAFPDLHATIEDVMTDDDKVVGRVTWHGTQQGSFAGIEPTGKKLPSQQSTSSASRMGKRSSGGVSRIFWAQSNNYNRNLEKVIPSSGIRKLDYQCYPRNTQRTYRP